MNILELIAANTAALIANTAALTGGAATTSAAADKPAAAGKGKAAAAKEKAPAGPSREDVVAALTEVKEKFGAGEAKAIITKVGAAKMAEIDDDQLGKAFELATKKLKTAEENTEGEDDGL